MSTRGRTWAQTVTPLGGGGSIPTFGNVVWGPDFGEGAGSDGTTLPVLSVVDLQALGLVGNIGVVSTVDLQALAAAYSTLPVVATADLNTLAISGGPTVVDTVDLEHLALNGGVSVASAIDLEALGLAGGTSISTAIDGTALGAPFWQSFASANGAAAVLKPSGTIEGDLLIAHCGVVTTAGAVWSAPVGWTLIREATAVGATSLTAATFYKIAGGSEPASYTFTATGGGTTIVKEIHRFNAHDATTPINVSAIATLLAAALDPDPDSPSVTTTVVNCLVVSFLLHDHLALTQSHTPAATHIERSDFEHNNLGVIIGANMQHRVFAAAGATGTETHNCTETVATNAVMTRIAIAPGTLDLVP